MKTDIIAIQKHVGVEPDGIIGPRTVKAIHDKLGLPRVPIWPTQAEVRRGTSIFGAPDVRLIWYCSPHPTHFIMREKPCAVSGCTG